MATEKSKTKVTFVVEEFPKNTSEIYLLGSIQELGGWDISKALKMQYYQNEDSNEEFILTVDIPKNTELEYKYFCTKSFEGEECGVVARSIPNRGMTTKSSKTRKVKDKITNFITK